jgi:hypothetical protein
MLGPPATPGAVRGWRNCLPRSVLFSCLTRRLSELAAIDDPVSLDDKLLLLGIIFQHRNNRRSDAELLDSLRGRAVSQPNTLPKVKTLKLHLICFVAKVKKGEGVHHDCPRSPAPQLTTS